MATHTLRLRYGNDRNGYVTAYNGPLIDQFTIGQKLVMVTDEIPYNAPGWWRNKSATSYLHATQWVLILNDEYTGQRLHLRNANVRFWPGSPCIVATIPDGTPIPHTPALRELT